MRNRAAELGRWVEVKVRCDVGGEVACEGMGEQLGQRGKAGKMDDHQSWLCKASHGGCWCLRAARASGVFKRLPLGLSDEYTTSQSSFY